MTYDVLFAGSTVYVRGADATAEMDFRDNRVRLHEPFGTWYRARDFTRFFRLAALIADGRVGI